MCGIVGIAGVMATREEKAFADLLVINAIRGFDSVGILEVERYSNKASVFRDVIPAANFIKQPRFDDLVNKGFSRVLLGHNRAATRGTIIPSNAHPFTHGPIIGVHNGTIYSQHKLKDHLKFTVDSDNIFYHIEQEGAEDMWSNLHGAAALVWWDKRFQNINFLRNKERPLFYALSEDSKTLFWASEQEMLYLALNRNHISFEEPEELPENEMYTFHIPKMETNKVAQFKIEEPEIKEFTPFVPKYKSYSVSSQGSWKNSREFLYGMWDEADEREKGIGIGSQVLFTIVNRFRSALDVPYLEGKMSEFPYLRIHIPFVDEKDRNVFLKKHVGVFEFAGIVAKITYPAGERILTIHQDEVGDANELFASIYGGEYEEPVKKEEEKKVKDHNGNPMGEIEFYNRYDHCGLCESDLLWEDAEHVEFLTYTDAICEQCAHKAEKIFFKNGEKDAA